MSRQWRRAFKLTVSGGGKSIDLSNFRVRFTVEDQTVQTLKTAVVTITNLSEATANSLPTLGGKVELVAGYEDNSGRIFAGDVIDRHIGRESPTDTMVTIYARTGDMAYGHAIANKTLKAGSTGKDVFHAAVEAMKPFGVTAGHIPDVLAQQKDPRSQAIFGMARDVLRKLALSQRCQWKIADDGKLHMLPITEAMPGGTVKLNSLSGLIGRPVQTHEGIIVRCLINPALRINGKLQIDEKSIDLAAPDLTYRGDPKNAAPYLGTIATDGIYKIIKIGYVGDTRGNDWYCDMNCNALGALTKFQATQGLV